MATCTNLTTIGPGEQSSKDGANSSNADGITLPTYNMGEEILSELPRCFVCDVRVQGRHYALATCRTQSSRARVIEKLGELVGERYMVVISEDDVICRGCANLMNTLDRLESEMRGVKDAILRFLERKYSLDHGELLGNSEIAKPCQPPQITKSQMQNGSGYHGRKRAAIAETSSDGNKQKKSNNVWMQCDKCRYTTRYNAFMVHHIRQHIKQRTSCDKCGMQLTAQQDLHLCKDKGYKIENIVTHEVLDDVKTSSAEIFTVNTLATSNVDKEATTSFTAVESDQQLESESKESDVQLIRLASPDDLQLHNIIASEDAATSEHGVYVRVLQHVKVGEGHPQVAVPTDTGADMVVNVKESSGKQMLTLAEDGSLEMVEVACWDDVDSSHPESDIPF